MLPKTIMLTDNNADDDDEQAMNHLLFVSFGKNFRAVTTIQFIINSTTIGDKI